MLDKEIHKHLDFMETLEDRVQADIDKLFKALDIDEIMDDPEIALNEFAMAVKEVITDKYAPMAINLGRSMANKIKKKDIKVQDTKDPKANEDLVDDKSTGKS